MNIKIVLVLLILMPWRSGFSQGSFGMQKAVFNKDSIASFSVQLPNGANTHLSPSKELLVIIWYMLTRNEPYRYMNKQRYEQKQRKLEHKR